VRIVLTSRFAMFVWWGRELVNLYNDAYRAFLGIKHPAALGKPAREVGQKSGIRRKQLASELSETAYPVKSYLIRPRDFWI